MADRQKTNTVRRSTSLSIIAALMLLTAAGIAIYWIAFLTSLDAQREGYFASRSEAWFAWELSFPLSDAWIAATAILGTIGLWRLRQSGLLFGLASSGAMVFLGLIDALFFLENGLYLPLNGEVAIQILIQAWMVGFGLFVIYTIWKHRNTLTN
jgi:hypothetical protein